MTEVTANASPTRSFFVDMLVRDISVDGAVLDLIDNAVDAAYHDSGGAQDLSEYRVEVTAKPDLFSIEDNCGGISIDDARDNVFRFGRPDDYDPKTRIGQFGIGLKRAVFRIGRRFMIESSTKETGFSINVDVDEWREQKGDWVFPMAIGEASGPDAGTVVRVELLQKGVQEEFSRSGYDKGMLREIASRYDQMLARGLAITLNGQTADMFAHQLLVGKGLAPEHISYVLDVDEREVQVRIVAGIAPPRRSVAESGWYVYCNGRLVLEADRTPLTGWGTGDVDGPGVPAWHTQYRRFRGFVFFEAANPADLPWTTTKTEIDSSSVVYRNALTKMRDVIRRYTSYTNAEKQEAEWFEEGEGKDPKPIATAVENAPHRSLAAIAEGSASTFRVPDQAEITSEPPGPRTTSIQFRADRDRVDEIKDALELKTNRQVGETAFERLYDEEIG